MLVIDTVDDTKPKRIQKEERNYYRSTDCCTKEGPKRPTSQNEEDAQDIIRAIKKAARVKTKPVPKDTEVFFMGEDAPPRTRNIKRLADAGAKVPPSAKRPRRKTVGDR